MECPRCGSFATIVERTKDFKYVVDCENCRRFEITGSEERTARLHYTKRMKEWAENPTVFIVPSQIRGKNAKMIKQDLLNGVKYWPIITKGLNVRFKTIGYLRVAKRDPEGRFTMDTEGVKVDDIANMQWVQPAERYRLQNGAEWYCVEGAYGKHSLVRCITDNPNSNSVREVFFLKPKG